MATPHDNLAENPSIQCIIQPKPDGLKNSDPFQFGSRFLLPDDDPMKFNAWDHVEVDDEYKEYARSQIEKQREQPVSEYDKIRFMSDPAKWWDIFYKNNRENFFKDRKWLLQEFPILGDATCNGAGLRIVVELGCGAGNTLFPILTQNKNPEFHIHGCDFSSQAVSLVKSHAIFVESHRQGNVSASVYDLGVPETLPDGIKPQSVDVVVMVFVFSALAPEQWAGALQNIRRMLKKGGKLLLRDYGRNDLAQVRFRGSRYLQENFYVRGDGTRVYFFEKYELEHIFTGESEYQKGHEKGYGGFITKELAVDKRMLVNRKRQIKMYRRWVQAIFEKS